MTEKLDVKRFGLAAGITGAIGYVLCVAYGFVTPLPALHHRLFELLLFFRWLDPVSFILGFLQVSVSALVGERYSHSPTTP